MSNFEENQNNENNENNEVAEKIGVVIGSLVATLIIDLILSTILFIIINLFTPIKWLEVFIALGIILLLNTIKVLITELFKK